MLIQTKANTKMFSDAILEHVFQKFPGGYDSKPLVHHAFHTT